MIHVSRNNIDLKDHLNNFAHAPHLKTLLLAVAAIMPVHHAAECLVNSHVVATTCDPAVWYTKYAPKQLTFWRTHLEGKKIAGSIMTMTGKTPSLLPFALTYCRPNFVVDKEF